MILETEMTGLSDCLVPEGKRIMADFKDLRLERSGQWHHLLEEGRLRSLSGRNLRFCSGNMKVEMPLRYQNVAVRKE